MNIHHLELFYYVAKHHGVSAAARHIPYGIQQPAISAQVLQLESSLGVTLFQRRPFQLTREGESLFRHIEPFFSGLPELRSRMTGGGDECLRIAAPELIQREYLPALLGRIQPKFRSSRSLRGEEAWLLKAFRSAAAASFRMLSKEREALSSQCSSLSVASNFGVWVQNKRRSFRFTLVEARQDQIEKLLNDQEVDIGLAVQTSKPSPGLHCTPINKFHLTLLAPEKLGIKKASELFALQRITVPLITLSGSDTVRRIFLDELRERRVEWLPSLELGSLDLVARYAAQGFGVGLSVELVRVRKPKGIIELPLEGFPPVVFSVFHRIRPSPLAKLFIEESLALARELFGPPA